MTYSKIFVMNKLSCLLFHKKFKCIRYFLDSISFLNLGILCADKRVVSWVKFKILIFFQLLNTVTVMKHVFIKAL